MFDDHGIEGTRPACPICIDNPGWAHDEEGSRREPADVCAACLGSGVVQPVDVDRVLAMAQRHADYARAALRNEAEQQHRLGVKRLANCAATLEHVVRMW